MKLTVGELKKFLLNNNIPDSAEIMVEAGHGQNIESGFAISISRDIKDCAEEMIFESDDFKEFHDEDALEDYDENGKEYCNFNFR